MLSNTVLFFTLACTIWTAYSFAPRNTRRTSVYNLQLQMVASVCPPKVSRVQSTSSTNGIISVTDESFENNILDKEGLAVVLFRAPWAGSSRLMEKVLGEVASETERRRSIRFAEINTDFNMDVATEYNVRSIPSLLVFKNGQVVADIVGVLSKRDLESIIQKAEI